MSKKKVKKFAKQVLYYLPKSIAHSILYAKIHKSILNLIFPKTYDEKIHWHIIHTYDEKYSKYADKYEVREYVSSLGYKDLLIPLVGGPYSSIEEIDFNNLPDEFIIKTTHASGPNHYYICDEKKNINMGAIKKQFDLALKENHAKFLFEYHYRTIKPRIIIEELLHDVTTHMIDYKVVCSYGKVIAILVCYNRDDGRDYYSTEWKYLDYVKEEYRSGVKIPRPSCLDRMLDAARDLSKIFPVCRIDFYNMNGRLYFGEITLTPSAGNHKNLNSHGLMELGRQIEYPKSRG